MSKLNDFLIKHGLKVEDLRPEEKETYRKMEETLTEEMTIDKILEFIAGELARIQQEFASNETSIEKDFLFKAQTRNYTALKYYIESPKLAKEKLEEYLRNLNPK